LLTVKGITDEDSVAAAHARNRKLITCKLPLGQDEISKTSAEFGGKRQRPVGCQTVLKRVIREGLRKAG
jgi:hypothetical protein